MENEKTPLYVAFSTQKQVEPVAAGPAGPLQIGPDAAVGRHPPATATLP